MTHLDPDQCRAVAHELGKEMHPAVAAYLQHTVNNRLSVVIGNIQLAQGQVADGEYLEAALKSARELREDIMQMTAHAVERN